MGEELGHLNVRDTVGLGALEVILERAVDHTLAHQRRHRDDRAQLEAQRILARPHPAKQHIIVELRELGRELA